MITKIIENVTGFIDDLNLTKRDVLSIIVVALLVLSGISTNYYKSKANRLEASMDLISKELKIEKDEDKVASGLERIRQLKRNVHDKDGEISKLYEELETIRSSANNRETIMEELGDIGSTEDVCNAFADMGYPICSKP